MRLFRRVFPVLCGLLCVVLVVPVRSATNLVANGDFFDGDAVAIDGWVQETNQATQDFTYFPRVAPSLRSKFDVRQSFRYSQCVDARTITGDADVGGSIATSSASAANIEVTLHTSAGCLGDPPVSATLVAPAGNTDWYDLSAQLDLPDGGWAYVKISVNQTAGGEDVYFDDIYLWESAATSVLLVQPSGRAPTGLIAAAVLVGIAVAIALRRRH
ncbi:MAG: hypothetical protein MUQ10_14890 [Anaerolineae bacterium]|nr:hypothetical protein [Anaerolineae bacterium]